MNEKVEKKISNSRMKILKVILLFICFSSCKTYKDTFRNEYGENVLYSKQSYCNIFEYNQSYKGYSPEKCFKIKYHFDKKLYQDLKETYYKVRFPDKKSVNKKSIKTQPFYKVYKSLNKNKDTLVNNFGYGLFYVSGKVFAPNFYFLRTETNLFFYNCNDKNILIKQLDKSKKINELLKSRISLFINKRCETKEGLKWDTGARFH